MNDIQINTFINVVRVGSFSKAEQVLYISRQALKKQIDSLERELGFSLFVRSSSGVCLTTAGQKFYDGIQNCIDDFTFLVDSCRNKSVNKNTVKIGAPLHPRLILEPVFLEFAKQFPSIKQEIIYCSPLQAVNSILSGEVDVTECIMSQKIDISKIQYIRLTDMPYFCIMLKSHPLADKKIISIKDLKGNVLGMRSHTNNMLINEIHNKIGKDAVIKTYNNEMLNVFTICYNNNIFISRAFYLTTFEPFVSIPLDIDIKSECCLLYNKTPSSSVKKFVNVAREVYA